MSRELREEADVGAVPAEDALVRVADHAEVGPVAPPALQQPELGGVDVLELVDEQMAEAPALPGGELAVGLERVRAQQQQVVEVDEPAPPLLVLVALVDRRDHRRRAAAACAPARAASCS